MSATSLFSYEFPLFFNEFLRLLAAPVPALGGAGTGSGLPLVSSGGLSGLSRGLGGVWCVPPSCIKSVAVMVFKATDLASAVGGLG